MKPMKDLLQFLSMFLAIFAVGAACFLSIIYALTRLLGGCL